MSTEITTIGLVLSGALDIRERFLRLLAGIEEARTAADRGTRAILAVRSEQCRIALGEYADDIASQLAIAAIADSEDPNEWSDESIRSIVDSAVHGLITLNGQHLAVYGHIPTGHRIREDLRYLLFRALDLSLVSLHHEVLVSAMPSEHLTWETTVFQSDDSKTRTAAVSIPWLESLGPLRWPLVVHEIGHHFLPGGRSTAQIVQQMSRDNSWQPDAFEEILADAVAHRYFGDSYAFALAREGYLHSFQRHVTGGLSVQQRLDALGGPEDLLELIPGQWNLGHRSGIDEETAEAVANDIVAEMHAAAEEAVDGGKRAEPNHSRSAGAVATARALMRTGEPVPAVPDSQAASAVARAVAERQESPSRDIRWVRGAGVHIALSDAEIYEVAWREEVDRPALYFVEQLLNGHEALEIGPLMQDVLVRDTWLARSLQSAAVHRWLITAADLERRM